MFGKRQMGSIGPTFGPTSPWRAFMYLLGPRQLNMFYEVAYGTFTVFSICIYLFSIKKEKKKPEKGSC